MLFPRFGYGQFGDAVAVVGERFVEHLEGVLVPVCQALGDSSLVRNKSVV